MEGRYGADQNPAIHKKIKIILTTQKNKKFSLSLDFYLLLYYICIAAFTALLTSLFLRRKFGSTAQRGSSVESD
jgi:hypothetical protein